MPRAEPGAGAEAVVLVPDANWSGNFQITGTPSQDDCGGLVTLLTQNILIDADARELEADVVDRRYAVTEIDASRLVAEGRFGTDVCPAATLFERWALQRQGDAWTGTLDATWPDSSNCGRACTVRFEINALRVAE